MAYISEVRSGQVISPRPVTGGVVRLNGAPANMAVAIWLNTNNQLTGAIGLTIAEATGLASLLTAAVSGGGNVQDVTWPDNDADGNPY